MSTIVVGIRRLFDAIGCNLREAESAEFELLLPADTTIKVYFGPKPAYGISVIQVDKYSLPGELATLGLLQFHQDATQSSYPRRFFLEISLTVPLDVSDELKMNFDLEDATAMSAVLERANALLEQFREQLDLCCGVIGLRTHRQFVLELVNENVIALRPQNYACNFHGPGVESLQSVLIDESVLQAMRTDLERLQQLAAEDITSYGLIFSWLMKAWQERDHINRFVALFIPMECLLHGISVRRSKGDIKIASDIRTLLRLHGGVEKATLIAFFDDHFSRRKPSIEERFAKLAEETALLGWKDDIRAFQHFNRMRNDLFHRGHRRVSEHLEVTESDAHSLQDMVERYACARIYGDDKVYHNMWRPSRGRSGPLPVDDH